jgi:thymidylate kinase
MLTVFTGLDGMGTSTISKKVSELDCGSILTRTPKTEMFAERRKMDEKVKLYSPTAHMLYYLTSVVAESDRIKKFYDLSTTNVYMVRYLIDTVVSNRVAGIDIPFDYKIKIGDYVHEILVPDLTVFIYGNETKRQERISSRGKDCLDKVLDDDVKRRMFYEAFDELLDDERTIYVDNSGDDPDKVAKETYQKIKTFYENNGKKVYL